MACRPQDYVTPSGRMTTNTVEGFHGLALMYRGKRTDLEHRHYTCKTNMAICHKVSQVTVKATNKYKGLNPIVEPWTYLESSLSDEHGSASDYFCCSKHDQGAETMG